MLRVSQINDRFGTVVSVEGQLTRDYVGVTEDSCIQALGHGTQVFLYLRDVTYIDQSGQDLLRRLADQGVKLLATGVYTSHLVNSLQPIPAAQRPNSAE